MPIHGEETVAVYAPTSPLPEQALPPPPPLLLPPKAIAAPAPPPIISAVVPQFAPAATTGGAGVGGAGFASGTIATCTAPRAADSLATVDAS